MHAVSPESIVDAARPAFEKALDEGNVFLANSIAMRAAEELFEKDAERARSLLWSEFFSRLAKGYMVQYQSFDFEVIDYKLCSISGFKRLFRGPVPGSFDANRRYITFLGAAQFFGRYQPQPLHWRVGEALGFECVNLSVGGAGPDSFSAKNFLSIANGGMAVVLQILSGRSIGCDEYPGGRMTFRKGDRKHPLDRLVLLRQIWRESRSEAERLVRKWQSRYVERILALINEVSVPIILVWISERSPDEWSIDRLGREPNFGKFPQLIDKEIVAEISRKCAQYVEVSRDPGLPFGFVSRFTGNACPVLRPDAGLLWKNHYYPSSIAVAELSSKIEAACKSMHLAA